MSGKSLEKVQKELDTAYLASLYSPQSNGMTRETGRNGDTTMTTQNTQSPESLSSIPSPPASWVAPFHLAAQFVIEIDDFDPTAAAFAAFERNFDEDTIAEQQQYDLDLVTFGAKAGYAWETIEGAISTVSQERQAGTTYWQAGSFRNLLDCVRKCVLQLQLTNGERHEHHTADFRPTYTGHLIWPLR